MPRRTSAGARAATSIQDEHRRAYVCDVCRAQDPEYGGTPPVPMFRVVTLFGTGPTSYRHRGPRVVADGAEFPNGMIALQWLDGTDERPHRIECFDSMRALVAKHGAEWDIVKREW